LGSGPGRGEEVLGAQIRPPDSSSKFITCRSATGFTQKIRAASVDKCPTPAATAVDFSQQLRQYEDRLVPVRTEMNREHLRDQHFERRHRTQGRREREMPEPIQ
jgi:hypothetical protein